MQLHGPIGAVNSSGVTPGHEVEIIKQERKKTATKYNYKQLKLLNLRTLVVGWWLQCFLQRLMKKKEE